jgi:hypothetical protein
MVQDFHDDYFGPVSSKYSLFLDQQVNLFSSGATAD